MQVVLIIVVLFKSGDTLLMLTMITGGGLGLIKGREIRLENI